MSNPEWGFIKSTKCHSRSLFKKYNIDRKLYTTQLLTISKKIFFLNIHKLDGPVIETGYKIFLLHSNI